MTAPTNADGRRLSGRTDEILEGRYRILRQLGEGGMGAVFEAEQLRVGHRVAIELMHPHLARRSGLVARFEREARTAGKIRCEHIAAVLDFGHAADGTPFLVMELLEGEPLSQLLARDQMLPLSRAVELALQGCEALRVAHEAGVVHRDLKPDNLFVVARSDGRNLLKVLDFGIAKVDDDGAALTATGATIGTAAYMSPEQARGSLQIDPRADIYALGAILYEALSGQRAHSGDSYNSTLFHVLHEDPISLAQLRPDLPASLVALVHEALARSPDQRPPSANELARLLSAHARQGSRPTDTRATTRADDDPRADLRQPRPTDSGVVVRRARQSPHWLLRLASVAALSAVMVGGVFVVRSWTRAPAALVMGTVGAAPPALATKLGVVLPAPPAPAASLIASASASVALTPAARPSLDVRSARTLAPTKLASPARKADALNLDRANPFQ